MGAGRPGRLDEPEFCKEVAAMYADGATRQTMADHFDVTKRTITHWMADPRVQAYARAIANERVMRIVRRTDSLIEARLQNLGEEDIETVLKIRKEYLNGLFKAANKGASTDVDTNELLNAFETNPEFADELKDLLKSNQAS